MSKPTPPPKPSWATPVDVPPERVEIEKTYYPTYKDPIVEKSALDYYGGIYQKKDILDDIKYDEIQKQILEDYTIWLQKMEDYEKYAEIQKQIQEAFETMLLEKMRDYTQR